MDSGGGTDDGADRGHPGNLLLYPGHDVTCTFTNTREPRIFSDGFETQ